MTSQRNDIAIVNFANDVSWYREGQQRLREELNKFNPEIAFFGFQTEEQIGSPKHHENPYAFKVYCFNRVMAMGFNKIIYADSSLYPIKSIQPIIDHLDNVGYVMEDSGHFAGQWCNENALNYFGVTKDEIKDVPMFTAGFLGLDLSRDIPRRFFNHWYNSMINGAFKGSWSDHRHDMTCGSVIAKCHFDMEYIPVCTYLAYIGASYPKPKETTIFHLKPTI